MEGTGPPDSDGWVGRGGKAPSGGGYGGGVLGRLVPAFRKALTALNRPAARDKAPVREDDGPRLVKG